MAKYNNNKIILDGITFDSKDEGKYYEYLKQLQGYNKIIAFERQPKYELIPAFIKGDKKYRCITYSPDFLIYHLDGTEELIDVKSMGTATQQGELRRKLFDYKYHNLKLTWVCRNLKWGDSSGWIIYEELKKIYAKKKRDKLG
jgi:hypothetical protein